MLRTLKAALLGASVLGGFSGAALAAAPVQYVGKPDAAQAVSFDVVLPLRNRAELDDLLAALHDPASPQYHHWLTPTEFGMRFGPDTATVNRVTAALQQRGFTVEAHTRTLHVTGAASLIETHFGTKLMTARAEPGHTHVVTAGALHMPAELNEAGAQIFSFSSHVMHTLSRNVGELPAGTANRYSDVGAYWYDDLKQAYSYPSNQATITTKGGTVPLDGTGATLGILMSSDALDSDIKAMFDNEGWSSTTGKPDPTLYQHVAINGGGGVNGGAFDEASLDTQQELGGAPGAHVILYNIPTLGDGDIFSGYVTIVESNTVDLVSSSFGECEQYYLPRYNGGVDQRGILNAEHELFLQGNTQGISFLASSGDSAGLECTSVSYFDGKNGKFIPSVSTPASDPAVTAVGGTNLVTTYVPGSLNSAYVDENAWEDPEIPYSPYGFPGLVYGGVWGAGGGYSVIWSKPAYQSLIDTGSTTARAVPDIGMMVGGCPGGIGKVNKNPPYCDGGNNPLNGNGNTQRSAVVVAIDVGQGGGFYGFIGTSVSSPELAGATARLIQKYGRMGNLNNYIYHLAAAQAANPKANYFHVNIPGYNGYEETLLNSTYSLSTGVGTPIVNNYVGARAAPLAGLPQSISNP